MWKNWSRAIRRFERYRQAQTAADKLLTYCRTSGEYPLTGRGDINTYAVFAELAYRLVAPHGRVGLWCRRASGFTTRRGTFRRANFVATADQNV